MRPDRLPWLDTPQSTRERAPMPEGLLAYAAGTLWVIGGVIVGLVLAGYAIYYIVFKLK
jgi:hypothetical protein